MALTARERSDLADAVDAKRPALSSTLFFERTRELSLVPGQERHMLKHLLTAERKYKIDLTAEKETIDRG